MEQGGGFDDVRPEAAPGPVVAGIQAQLLVGGGGWGELGAQGQRLTAPGRGPTAGPAPRDRQRCDHSRITRGLSPRHTLPRALSSGESDGDGGDQGEGGDGDADHGGASGPQGGAEADVF